MFDVFWLLSVYQICVGWAGVLEGKFYCSTLTIMCHDASHLRRHNFTGPTFQLWIKNKKKRSYIVAPICAHNSLSSPILFFLPLFQRFMLIGLIFFSLPGCFIFFFVCFIISCSSVLYFFLHFIFIPLLHYWCLLVLHFFRCWCKACSQNKSWHSWEG